MFGTPNSLFDLKITPDPRMVLRKWVFPSDRFVEWGPKDESYCRFAGFGHEVVYPDPVVYRVGNRLIMHPAIAKQLREQIDAREKAR